MRVLLTGAGGFIGKFVAEQLIRDHQLILILRKKLSYPLNGSFHVVFADLTQEIDWLPILSGVDVIVHLAARAHVVDRRRSVAKFDLVNVNATIKLAAAAAGAGVKRFVFLSSIGVNGQVSKQPFTEDDFPNPSEPYAVSKLKAEFLLLKLALETSMEVVIVRPPLVYGPGAPGNFRLLLKLISSKVPLPFKNVQNKRTLIGVRNLADFVSLCVVHPYAGNNIFIVGDDDDISTENLVRVLGRLMCESSILYRFPLGVIALLAGIFNRSRMYNGLFGSLQASSAKARVLLGWSPPYTQVEGFSETVSDFKSGR